MSLPAPTPDSPQVVPTPDVKPSIVSPVPDAAAPDANKSAEVLKAEVDAKALSDAEAAKGAPEKYEFKAPDGVTLDSEGVQSLSTIAKELNLSQEAAQKFIDLAVKHQAKVTTQSQEAFTKTRAEWIGQIKADKEIGGANYEPNVELARRAIAKFGSPELSEVLNSGWGDHPAIVKAFVKIGKALAEDRAIDGSASTGELTAAQVMYPGQTPGKK